MFEEEYLAMIQDNMDLRYENAELRSYNESLKSLIKCIAITILIFAIFGLAAVFLSI